MTPAARIAAAAEILDRAHGDVPVERALTGWARGARYAGSGDRAAVRDLVYGALRRRRSLAALGGAATGRGLMIGHLRVEGVDPDILFTGQGHAAAPLTAAERAEGHVPMPGSSEALDCPDWIRPALEDSLGTDTEAVLEALRHRAPVHLRVNLARASRDAAQAALAADGIRATPHPLSPAALEVVSGERRIRSAQAYATGVVELQDAASQAVSDAVPLGPGGRMLDYCAGGGGKTLAVAARVKGRFHAHDAEPRRMTDLPARAARAGVEVRRLAPGAAGAEAPYDCVLVDAPCSGSGSWRRDPEGKWRLDPAGLSALLALQARILDEAAPLVAPGGALVYATCSLLQAEDADQIDGFVFRSPGWTCLQRRRLTPLDGGDGFYFAILERTAD